MNIAPSKPPMRPFLRVIIGLIILILVLSSVAPVLGLFEYSTPTSGDLNRVAYEYDDGTYSGSGMVATIAQHDKNVYSGIIFPDIVIPANASVSGANLTVYYWNNLNYTEAPTNILIEAIPGNPSAIYPGLLKTPAVTTASYYTYDISGWDSEGNKTLDITNIIRELHEGYSWNHTANNVLIRIMALAPTGPGIDPDYYRYEISTNTGPVNEKPVLSIEYDEGEIYQGWTLTPTYSEASGFMLRGRWDGEATSRSSLFLNRDDITPSGWYNYTLPLPQYRGTGGDDFYKPNDKACIIGNTIYYLGENGTDSTVSLFNCSMDHDELSAFNWTLLGEVFSFGTSDDIGLCYNPNDNMIYIFCVTSTGDLYYTYYDVSSGAITQLYQIYNGYSDIGSGLDTVLDPVTGKVFGAFGVTDQLGSQRRIRVYKFENVTSYTGNEIDGGGTNYYGPIIEAYDDRIMVFYGAPGETEYHTRYEPVNFTREVDQVLVSSSISTTSYGHEGMIDSNGSRMWTISTAYDGGNYDKIRRSRYSAYDTKDITGNMDAERGTNNAYWAVRYWDRYWGQEAMLLMHVDTYQIYKFYNPEYLYTPSGNYSESEFWSHWDTGIDYDLVFMMDSIQRGTTFNLTGYFYTPPPGDNSTCVDAYLLAKYGAGPYSYDEITEGIDACNIDDPDNPGGGGFDEADPWWVSRKQFKLYFILLGLFFIAYPWVMWASTRDPQWIAYIIMLNTIGLGLLWAIIDL